jgi:hypothetical protein
MVAGLACGSKPFFRWPDLLTIWGGDVQAPVGPDALRALQLAADLAAGISDRLRQSVGTALRAA